MTDGAFDAFVHQHHRALYRTALAISGDPGQAEDLVQTALSRLYARWDRIGTQEPLSYARRIVVNAHHDRWRRGRGREQLVADAPEPEASPDPTGSHADRDALLRALAELTLKERRVVVLRFLCDLSEAETAAELGIRPGSVKSTSSRAMGKLRLSPHLSIATEEAR
jgi:RNA polymerase sigma-70 factor (sigma-E family)